MDDDFTSSSGDDNFRDLDLDNRSAATSSSSTSNRQHPPSRQHCLFVNDDVGDNGSDKLCLVPYRWLHEVQSGADRKGILYNASSIIDDSEIVLELRRQDNLNCSDDAEEGFPGPEYALVSESMFLRALKRHNDCKGAVKDANIHIAADDQWQDGFPVNIRLSISHETNSLVVKINLKDISARFYRKACNIFSPNSDLLHIWDFSGQTTQFFINDRVDLPNGSLGQSGEEVSLELQVHGFSDSKRGKYEKIDEMLGNNKIETSFSSGSDKMNGSIDYMSSYSTLTNSPSCSSYGEVGLMGLRGLQNLGNTCFMNSAVQCLAHISKLVDYFLGDYRKEINRENPLGTRGELAVAFADLLRKLWAPGATSVAPHMFKLKLSNFARQFSGNDQHDSQEFLAYLLDGLHEDLNRVKCKPYIEAKDADGRPDKEVAEEYWRNHLARNDSIIVNLFHGQYRSTLICPVCKKKSVTFDPFMYLSLPLPSTKMRMMTLTVLAADGIRSPSYFTVNVPKLGTLEDLIEALSIACSLRDDETLLVAEIYRNKIFHFLEEPSDSLALIRDDDKLVAYRLPKDNDASPLVVFVHERVERPYEFEKPMSNRKLFGIPLVARVPHMSKGLDLHKLFLKLVNPFIMPTDDELNEYDGEGVTANVDSPMEDALSPTITDGNSGSDGETEDSQHLNVDFEFYWKDNVSSIELKMNEPLPAPKLNDKLNVHVFWSDKMIEKYDTCVLSTLHVVFRPQVCPRRSQESVSLYKCLEAFLKEEPLGVEDMWHCPSCKEDRQAIKKLDLWRLPEILVIHLKRFSNDSFLNKKPETYVDFPVNDMDLSPFIFHKNSQFCNRYRLFAISVHYGNMIFGHYTAYIDHGHGRWYNFDDYRVEATSEDNIKSSGAYILFYRRVA